MNDKSIMLTLSNMSDSLNPTCNVVAHPNKFYQSVVGNGKLARNLNGVVEQLAYLGNLVMILYTVLVSF